jgi:hypothetical protein
MSGPYHARTGGVSPVLEISRGEDTGAARGEVCEETGAAGWLRGGEVYATLAGLSSGEKRVSVAHALVDSCAKGAHVCREYLVELQRDLLGDAS